MPGFEQSADCLVRSLRLSGIIDMKNNWPSPIQNRGLKKTAPNSSGWGSVIKGHKKQSSV